MFLKLLHVPPSHVSQNGFLHFYLMECLVNKGENEWHKFMFAGGAIFSGIAFGIMLDFRGSLSCGQIFANGIADFEGEREGVSFWSCSSCSFICLDRVEPSPCLWGSRLFLFLSSSVLIL